MTENKAIDDCSRHRKDVLGCADMKQLAEMIGDLHYETLAELMYRIAVKFKDDGNKDDASDRKKLATKLFYCYNAAMVCHWGLKEAWEISKPFMSQSKTTRP